jgi:hypothetical protein
LVHPLGKDFASHKTVNHTIDEYVRGHVTPTRSKAPSRSALGVNDFERAEIPAPGIKGKRLTYRRADSIRKAEAITMKRGRKPISRETKRFMRWRARHKHEHD